MSSAVRSLSAVLVVTAWVALCGLAPFQRAKPFELVRVATFDLPKSGDSSYYPVLDKIENEGFYVQARSNSERQRKIYYVSGPGGSLTEVYDSEPQDADATFAWIGDGDYIINNVEVRHAEKGRINGSTEFPSFAILESPYNSEESDIYFSRKWHVCHASAAVLLVNRDTSESIMDMGGKVSENRMFWVGESVILSCNAPDHYDMARGSYAYITGFSDMKYAIIKDKIEWKTFEESMYPENLCNLGEDCQYTIHIYIHGNIVYLGLAVASGGEALKAEKCWSSTSVIEIDPVTGVAKLVGREDSLLEWFGMYDRRTLCSKEVYHGSMSGWSNVDCILNGKRIKIRGADYWRTIEYRGEWIDVTLSHLIAISESGTIRKGIAGDRYAQFYAPVDGGPWWPLGIYGRWSEQDGKLYCLVNVGESGRNRYSLFRLDSGEDWFCGYPY